jgi:hypothetical protein
MTTLVIDTGHDIVGIFSVEENNFTAYRSEEMKTAIRLIEVADEVVTFNGSDHGQRWSDLVKLGEIAGIADELPLKGRHTDMRTVCWSDRIMGSSLANTYKKQFGNCPDFPDTHEGSCESDVYMTFKLWEAWKQGTLKIIDGRVWD